jgi:hypothetical protein
MLTLALASRFSEIALAHVTREYPNKLDHVLSAPGDAQTPRALHPIFYGSFDWHSCVHGYWLLARLYRRYPAMPQAPRIRQLFHSAFTPEHVAGELAYLTRKSAGGFERPYGWVWLLKLAAELAHHDHADGASWAACVTPLAHEFARRFLALLPKATSPVRTGMHSNTAFALVLALDYAKACEDPTLQRAATEIARRWYLADADCQAWEPSGEDFLSPALIEAECMRCVLPKNEFADWFTRFLPNLESQTPAKLFRPVTVSDRSDGRIAHLDGLNLTRAWCWNNLASALRESDPRVPIMHDTAARHRSASLPYVAGDYMGEHWLATFAVLALEAAESASR